jgi:tRNA(fMet)-specific endonuclease VapC
MTVAELKYGKVLGQLKGGPKYKEQTMKEFFNAITIVPMLIGCTAVAKKMILVTENVKDFENIKDIRIENWVDRTKR